MATTVAQKSSPEPSVTQAWKSSIPVFRQDPRIDLIVSRLAPSSEFGCRPASGLSISLRSPQRQVGFRASVRCSAKNTQRASSSSSAARSQKKTYPHSNKSGVSAIFDRERRSKPNHQLHPRKQSSREHWPSSHHSMAAYPPCWKLTAAGPIFAQRTQPHRKSSLHLRAQGAHSGHPYPSSPIRDGSCSP